MELILHTFQLKLKYTFTISRWSRDFQDTVIVELRDGVYRGYGEAAVNSYYHISKDDVLRDLTALKPTLEQLAWDTPEELWAAVKPSLAHNSFALCALDMAAWDLHARRKGVPLYKLWDLDSAQSPMSNYTIGIGSIETMRQRMHEMPWPLYKIKLGTENDLEIVRALRQETEAVFRVDANCAWTAEQTLQYAPILQGLGVEFIEQPLPAQALAQMATVYQQSALPLIADENCVLETDVAHCYEKFHGINIKLTKCGGLTPARRMIAQARRLGLKVMVGCMTESSVGISAIAHLAPLLDYVDMDGALLLEDIAAGVTLKNGAICYPSENGTGVHLLDSALDT